MGQHNHGVRQGRFTLSAATLRNCALGMGGALFLSGCVSNKIDYGLPEPLRPAKQAEADAAVIGSATEAAGQTAALNASGTTEVSAIPQAGASMSGIVGGDEPGEEEEAALTLNVVDLPLPGFINEVFGNLLAQNFVLSDKLKDKKDLVTLRVSEAQTPSALSRIAEQVLDEYGVSITQQGDLLRFDARRRSAADSELPLLISGAALPDVPASHRPVYYFYPLRVISTSDAQRWLKDAYNGKGLQIMGEASQGMVQLRGTLDVVRQAAEALAYLDRPYMRGRTSVRINPAFVKAAPLAKEVAKILRAQGYDVRVGGGGGSIALLPLTLSNSILVFANDRTNMRLVERWIRELDKPEFTAEEASSGFGIYYYSVRNTLAEDLVAVIEPVLKGLTDGDEQGRTSPIVTDPNRNGLLFNGDPEVWQRLLPILKEMDKPARQVLVEVTVATYNLNDSEKTGFSWFYNSQDDLAGKVREFGHVISDAGASSGLSWALKTAGATNAVLNALTTNSAVDILATPRVLVKSGESASINVGDQVPIITSRQTDPNSTSGGSSNILQNVEYRDTGTILNVTPVVLSGDRVDLQLTQEVSAQGDSGVAGSPVFQNTYVDTNLTLTDGSAVLIGGLIRENLSDNNNGIPLLKDIPGLGRLFSTRGLERGRQEVMVIIRPYIVDDGNGAEEVTNAFRSLLTPGSSASEN